MAIRDQGLDLGSAHPILTFCQKNHTIHSNISKNAEVELIRPTSLSELQVPMLFFVILLADYYDSNIKITMFCSNEARAFMKTIKSLMAPSKPALFHLFSCSAFTETWIAQLTPQISYHWHLS